MVSIEKMIHRATNHLIAFRLEKYYVFETQADTRVLVRCDVRSDSTSFTAAPLTRRTVM